MSLMSGTSSYSNDYSGLEALVQQHERSTFKTCDWQKNTPVSIIVPTYNRKDLLRKNLLALSQQTYDLSSMEVIVADDGSSDGTEEMLRTMDLPFKVKHVWQRDDGYQLSKNRNNGLKQASHEHVVILDVDMIPTHDAIENYMKWNYAARETDSNVLLIGRRRYVEPEWVTDNLIKSRQLHTVRDTAHRTDGKTRDWREERYYDTTNMLKNLSTHSDPLYPLSSSFCAGHVSFNRRHAFEAGLFDEEFTAWGAEDNVFGYNYLDYFKKLGQQTYTVPLMNSTALHMEHPVNMAKRAEEVTRTRVQYEEKKRQIKASQPSQRPRVSVYVPAYNVDRFIEKTIESIAQQTYKDIEICVVDDKSTDATSQKLQNLQHKYNQPGKRPLLRVERNPTNVGGAATTNRAIRMCRGEYILQVDGDDEIKPTCIEDLVKVLDRNNNVVLAFGDCIDRTRDGIEKPHWSCDQFTEEHIRTHGYRASLSYLRENGMCIHAPRMFRRSAYYQIEGVNEHLPNAFDYDLCIKLSDVGEIRHLKKQLYVYNISHGGNISHGSSTHLANAERVKEAARVRRSGKPTKEFHKVDTTAFTTGKQYVTSVYMPLSAGNVKYLRQALDSVLDQTLLNVGVCIAFDDSAANAQEFLKVLEDPKYKRFFKSSDPEFGRIKYVIHGKNKGQGSSGAASNTAVNLALDVNKSKYVVQLDPDDYFCHKGALEQLVRFMETQQNCGLAYADFNCVNERGEVIQKGNNSGEFSRTMLWNGYNQVGAPRVYRADLLRTLRSKTRDQKVFDERLLTSVDLDLILRAEKELHATGKAVLHYEGEPEGILRRKNSVFLNYRQHGESITATKSDIQAGIYRLSIRKHTDTLSEPLFERELSQFYYEKGLEAKHQKNYNEAQRYLSRTLSLTPTHIDANYHLGSVYLLTKEYANALSYFDNVLTHNPRHSSAIYAKGLCYLNLGRKNEADIQFRRTLAVNPTHTEARNLLQVH